MGTTERVIVVQPELRYIASTRQAVREELAACGVADTDDAELMVSELVGNAIVHAGTKITVTVRCTHERTVIGVHDHSPSCRNRATTSRCDRAATVCGSSRRSRSAGGSTVLPMTARLCGSSYQQRRRRPDEPSHEALSM